MNAQFNQMFIALLWLWCCVKWDCGLSSWFKTRPSTLLIVSNYPTECGRPLPCCR